MEQKLTMQQSLAVEQYVKALRGKLQSRAEQIARTSKDKEKAELVKLQDEITALAELYRYYYNEIIEGYKTDRNRLQEIQQIEKILTSSKEQMINGQIDEKHFLEVVRLARKSLQLICQTGKLGKYVDLLLVKPKEKEER